MSNTVKTTLEITNDAASLQNSQDLHISYFELCGLPYQPTPSNDHGETWHLRVNLWHSLRHKISSWLVHRICGGVTAKLTTFGTFGATHPPPHHSDQYLTCKS